MGLGYFIDNQTQQNWDNLTYWRAAGQLLSATYTVSQYATAVTVNLEYNIIGNSCPLGACSGKVAFASATIQYGTSAPVTILAVNCAISGNSWFNYTHKLTSSELQSVLNSNQQIIVTVKSCAPAIGSYNLEYELTATADVTLSKSTQGRGSITVNVTSPYGSPNTFYPATVTLTDTSTNSVVGVQTINSSSTTFTGLNIGDNYTASVNMPPFGTATQSALLSGTTANISVTMSCPYGQTYQTNILGQPQCVSGPAPQWMTGLEVAIIGAVIITAIAGVAYASGKLGGITKGLGSAKKLLE